MNSSGRSRKDGGKKRRGAKSAAEQLVAEHLVEVAHEVLAETPDVRAEKLKALKHQLETGTYHPDEGAVAEGLIREHLGGGKGRGR